MRLGFSKIKKQSLIIASLAPIVCVLPREFTVFYLICLIGITILYFNRNYERLWYMLPSLGFILYCCLLWGTQELRELMASGVLLLMIAQACFCVLYDKLTRIFVVSSIFASHFVGALALLQFFGVLPTSVDQSIYSYYNGVAFFRSTALFPHATSLGLFCLFLLPIIFIELLNRKQGYGILLSSLLFLMAALVSTLGRSVFLVSVFFLFFGMVFWAKNHMKKKGVWRLIALAIAVLIFSLFFIKDNELANRFARIFEWKGASAQRWQEYQLGFSLISKNPMGYGQIGAKAAANQIIQQKKQSGGYWEFSEWRGVHNFFISAVLNWGVVGLLLFLLSLCVPLLKIGKGAFSLIFLASLLFYGMTDGFVYSEIAPLLAALLWYIPLNPPDRSGFSSSKPLFVLVVVIASFSLPNIRRNVAQNLFVKRIYFDNPLDKPMQITVDDCLITVPALGHRVWNTVKNKIVVGHEGRVNSYELSSQKRNYLVLLSIGGVYRALNYYYDEAKDQVGLKTYDLPINSVNKLYHLPDWVGLFPHEFQEPPSALYSKSFIKLGSNVRLNIDAKRIIRVDAPPQLLWDCWEPIWYYTLNNLNLSTCGWRRDRTGYGIRAIKTQIAYFAELFLVFCGLRLVIEKEKT